MGSATPEPSQLWGEAILVLQPYQYLCPSWAKDSPSQSLWSPIQWSSCTFLCGI